MVIGHSALAVPSVSIIIATYNWSAALEFAIRSVLDQTLQDFELLVVGDACTDDTEQIVGSFNDARIRWFNLPTNHGSQYAPNNFGLKQARAYYIAYLGHDDLWWPTHLKSLVDKARERDADVVAGVTIMYGPPQSGIRAVTGLFPGGTFNIRYFFPPSSMLHKRELAARVGGWKAPSEARGNVDYDLLVRFLEQNAKFESTGELTTFKFNAAWRRDAYQRRDATEQRDMRARMELEGENFRRSELISVVHSVLEDKFVRVEWSEQSPGSTLAAHLRTARFKGSRLIEPRPLADEEITFYVEEPYSAFEWQALESADHLKWRYSGPATRSSVTLPGRVDRPCELRIEVMGFFPEASMRAARLLVHGQPLQSSFAKRDDGGWIWRATLDPEQAGGKPIEAITIAFDRPTRPFDDGVSEDRRWLGVPVGRITLVPAVGKGST
jgi:glycosyltransferase involved in cell wall biosynthesis